MIEKQLTAIFSLFLSSILFSGVVIAQDTDTVTATVTAQNVAVSVADGTVAYGTLSLSGTNDTTLGNLNDSQTATNDGNVNVDLNIRGQNSANWTLAGTQGANEYRHRFCTTDCDGTPVWTALTTNYQALAASVAASGTQVFDLEIGVPSSTTFYTQQSVDVQVQATAS